jgi:hypothetical protein
VADQRAKMVHHYLIRLSKQTSQFILRGARQAAG